MNDVVEPNDDEAVYDTATGLSPTIRLRGSNAENLRATIARKLDDLFTGRTFDIVREVHLGEGQFFHTVTGSRARRGYVLKDRVTGEHIAVGTTMLKLINRRYLGVSLPPDGRLKHNRPARG